MKNNKIYIVGSGFYLSIIACFSTRELAESFVSAFKKSDDDDAYIIEKELDTIKVNETENFYTVFLDKNKSTIYVHHQEACIVSDKVFVDNEGNYACSVFAQNEQKAVIIAKEKIIKQEAIKI